MTGNHQQFSLKWNNYSHHIVTALEELRVDDELTDVTLSTDGQRIKAHKVLLSACSVFFKETFKENPCKHPIVILKGVSFQDLQAVVQFMYNGQVNVSQERLPSFLQTAEILQIKGLTDSANEREDGSPAAPVVKKRAQTFPSQASTTLDSIRQDGDARPPTPKRKRVIGGTSGSFASAQNSELPGTSVISSSGNGTAGTSGNNSATPSIIAHNSDNSGDGLPIVKFEEQELDDDYERQEEDGSFQDNDKDGQAGDANSLGSHIRTTSASGAVVERRPRYTFQPSNDLATGVVDATNAAIWARNTGLLDGIGAGGAYDDAEEDSIEIDTSSFPYPAMNNNGGMGLDSGGEEKMVKREGGAGGGASSSQQQQGYVCPICGHVSRSAGGRSNHMQTHRDPKICPICHQTFLRRDNLNRHIREKHQGIKRRPYNSEPNHNNVFSVQNQ